MSESSAKNRLRQHIGLKMFNCQISAIISAKTLKIGKNLAIEVEICHFFRHFVFQLTPLFVRLAAGGPEWGDLGPINSSDFSGAISKNSPIE
jgi:hypothetical protein